MCKFYHTCNKDWTSPNISHVYMYQYTNSILSKVRTTSKHQATLIQLSQLGGRFMGFPVQSVIRIYICN